MSIEPKQVGDGKWIAIIAAGIATALWGLWPLISSWLVYLFGMNGDAKLDLQKTAPFGDTFGSLNTLFTGLALIAVGWAAWMQKQELKVQQKALVDQIEETVQTRAVFQKQAFEATFFQMLKVFDDLADRNQKYIEHVGTFTLGFLHEIHSGKTILKPPEEIGVKEVQEGDIARGINLYFEQHYLFHEKQLAPVFRMLYHLLQLIDESGLIDKEKFKYADIVRSALTTPFLVLLACNCANPDNHKGLTPFLSGYRLLKHLPTGPARSVLEKVYPAEVFLSRS
jgi:hypothetical protein